MRNHRRQTTATLAAWLLVIAGAGAVRAQTTPPFNPNAESPVDDSEGTSATDGISDAVDDIDGIIEDTTGDIDGIIEDTTGDIDGAIQDQLGNVTDPLEEVTGDIFGEGGIGEINDTVGDVFGAYEDIQGSISDLTETFNSLFNIDRLLDTFNFDFLDIFKDPLGGLAGGDGDGGGDDGDDGSNTVEITTGALGLPDAKQIEAEIQNARPSAFEEITGSKTGGEGSPVIKLDLVTQFERNLTDEVADQTALTEEGQQKLRENAEAATAALEGSQQLAQDSESQDVSQNILRNISGQLALQQQTGTLTTVDNQLRARDDALRNKMLVDAVRELQGGRIQDRRETASAYSDAITQGAQIILPGAGINPAGSGGGNP
jgi:hypothetical protein